MKVEIRDSESLAALQPLEVAAYLRARGWLQGEATVGRASLWRHEHSGEEYEALLPLDQTLRDFTLRMGDLIHVLAEVEERSQAEIYADLLTTTSDVMRIRLDDPDLQDGTVPIEVHAQLAQRARDLVLAAACAVTEHRPVWHTRKPTQAMEHVRRVRIGQTERGSYVITVISRVTPLLHTVNGEMDAPPPFERLVSQTLAGALSRLDRAAEEAALTGEFASFDSAVAHGVSANLCDAVAGLWGEEQGSRRLEFSFSWAPARPLYVDAPARVAFPPDRIGVIREAGRLLRERAPITDFVLEGAVVKLERTEGSPTGRVTVMGLVDGQPRRIALELQESQYLMAVQAHAEAKVFRCFGTLVREGKSYSLQDPRDVTIVEE